MRAGVAFILFLFFAAACAREPTTIAQLSRVGPAGVAIDGYSPVSYHSKGVAERGSAAYAAVHEGVTYWLTDESQVALFTLDPEKFVPAHGGWCSLMLTGSGNLTPADPETFKIVDGRLLLFWSGEFNGNPISGLKNWASKFESPAEERALLGKADAIWDALLAGRKKQQVIFFSPADEPRVSETRRAGAKKQY